jgi:putative addiction module component (TIGR02574 family)
MRAIDIPQIEKLSTPEKIRLVEDLWDKIIADEHDILVPQSHKKELSKRLRRYKTTPGPRDVKNLPEKTGSEFVMEFTE